MTRFTINSGYFLSWELKSRTRTPISLRVHTRNAHDIKIKQSYNPRHSTSNSGTFSSIGPRSSALRPKERFRGRQTADPPRPTFVIFSDMYGDSSLAGV